MQLHFLDMLGVKRLEEQGSWLDLGVNMLLWQKGLLLVRVSQTISSLAKPCLPQRDSLDADSKILQVFLDSHLVHIGSASLID